VAWNNRGMAESDEFITIHAVSFESLAVRETQLKFSPPLQDQTSKPEAFEFWWKLIQYAFELPDPSGFPPLLPEARSCGDDLDRLDRYIAAAEDMAQSTVLAGDDSLTVHLPEESGPERVETAFSSNEATRGFTVLFRQFHSQKEPASFSRVQRVLRDANARANDNDQDARNEHLNEWGRALRSLKTEPLKVRVGEKLQREGKMPRGDIPGQGALSPEQLISAYQYGDLIHWGDQRSVISAASNDPFDHAWQRLAFLEAITGPIHIYLGFSLVVRAALGR